MRKSNIAVVMMALMVSIPFCTSIAFASLTNPTVTGSENIAGYIKRQDSATFSFDAEEGDIAGADVHFVNERDGPLFQCAWNIDGRYTCSYTTDSNNLPDGAFSRNALVVRSDEVVDQIAIPGVKDIAGPRIPVLSVTPETIGSGNIKVDYRIEDQVTAGDTTRCIGIKDLTLKIGDFVQTIPINTEANHCVYESSITKSIGDVTSMIEGFLPIEARAVDRFDQKSAVATATVTVNRGKPVIMENTFRLFDSRNRDIQYIKSGTEAFAEIEIQDNDLVSARADFSALSSHNGVSDASCSEGVCKWDRVTITETGSREVTITARDALGNSDTKTFSVVIQADDTSPVIQGLHSNRMDSAGVSYLGKKNNILSAEIDESDVGIDRNSIHLDLSSVGKGSAVAPTNCSRSDNMWTCYWNIGDINIADGIKRISMVPGSTDNLGNSIDGVLKYDFTVDLTPPQITSITSTPQAVTSGDKLTITVQASDSNPIVAIVNLTGISSSGVAQSACDEKCIVEIEDIVPSYTVADVPITVEDAAGNTITKRQRVTVLQANENATPNFFTVSNTQVIPNRIDKQVASQIPVEIFVHVVLSGAGSGRILDKTIDCPDMTDYAASWQLMNDAGNDPYIAIVLNQRAGTMESIPIKCTLKLAVRDDRNIYRRLEEESISASLSVYGNAFGDLTDAAKQKLEAINNEIQETEDDIQNYQQIIDTWGIWCQISEGLGTLNSVLQGIKSVLYLTYSILWVACTAEILPPAILGCQKLNEAAWFGSSCEVFSKYQQFIEFWIWPTGYVGPGIVGMVNKYSCMIGFHCMLCNINELYNVAMDWVMHGIAMSVNTGVTSDGDRIGKGSTVDTPDGEGTVVGFDKSGNALVSQEGNIAKTYDSKNLQIAKKPSAGSGSQGSSQESGPWSPGDADSVTRSTKKTNPKKPDAGWNAGTRPGKDNPNWQYKGEFDARGRATPGAMQQNRKTGDTYVYAMDKNDQTSYKWQQTYDGWEEQGLTTTSTPDPGFLFNPYKSIHFAKACLCLPAIVYNLEKNKQIKCMYRNCITQHIKAGLPTTDCDMAFKERHCLYVEGAEYLKNGFGGMLDNIAQWALDNAAMLAMSITYIVSCWSYIIAPEGICAEAFGLGVPGGGFHPTWCGTLGSAMGVMELVNTFTSEFSFLNYNQELEGEDYCASTGY